MPHSGPRSGGRVWPGGTPGVSSPASPRKGDFLGGGEAGQLGGNLANFSPLVPVLSPGPLTAPLLGKPRHACPLLQHRYPLGGLFSGVGWQGPEAGRKHRAPPSPNRRPRSRVCLPAAGAVTWAPSDKFSPRPGPAKDDGTGWSPAAPRDHQGCGRSSRAGTPLEPLTAPQA